MGYPTKGSAQPGPSARAQNERLDALLGDRGQSTPALKAVTRGDAAEAGLIALQARIITAAPTAAQYNALVADVKALATVLARLGASFSGL